MSRKDHPTAEVVYEHVLKAFPNISLGTVYRNLSFFWLITVRQSKFLCEDGSVHFDGNVMPHYHFQCTECGAVIDLDFDGAEESRQFCTAAASNFAGQIEGNVTFFYGKCPSCAHKTSSKRF